MTDLQYLRLIAFIVIINLLWFTKYNIHNVPNKLIVKYADRRAKTKMQMQKKLYTKMEFASELPRSRIFGSMKSKLLEILKFLISTVLVAATLQSCNFLFSRLRNWN